MPTALCPQAPTDSATALTCTLTPRVLSCFRERQDQHYHMQEQQWPRMGCWGLLCLEDGSMQIQTELGSQRIGPGTAVLATPRRVSGYRACSHLRMRRLEFDVVPRQLSPQAREAGVFQAMTHKPCQPEPEDIWGSDLPSLLPAEFFDRSLLAAAAITDHFHTDESGRCFAHLRLAGWLAMIVEGLIIGQYKEHPPIESSADPIERAENRASTEFAYGHTVEDMARSAGLSHGHFCRLYRSRRGYGPGRFLSDLRYECAQKLLQNGNATLPSIAKDTGFRSVSSFSKGFKQRTGMSPGQWRRVHRGY